MYIQLCGPLCRSTPGGARAVFRAVGVGSGGRDASRGTGPTRAVPGRGCVARTTRRGPARRHGGAAPGRKRPNPKPQVYARPIFLAC